MRRIKYYGSVLLSVYAIYAFLTLDLNPLDNTFFQNVDNRVWILLILFNLIVVIETILRHKK